MTSVGSEPEQALGDVLEHRGASRVARAAGIAASSLERRWIPAVAGTTGPVRYFRSISVKLNDASGIT